jgi:hypothetical protein
MRNRKQQQKPLEQIVVEDVRPLRVRSSDLPRNSTERVIQMGQHHRLDARQTDDLFRHGATQATTTQKPKVWLSGYRHRGV